MKTKSSIILYICVILLSSACSSNIRTMNKSEILVTDSSDLEKYVNRKITIRGLVVNSKIPTIIGVDISSDNPDLRGEVAEATGVLIKLVVSKDEVDKTSANRGPGVFYKLRDLNAPYSDAQVVRIKK